jgi:hypothetical protein
MVTTRRWILMIAFLCLALASSQVMADVSVTGFSTTNTSAGGTGDVTITFTTDEANFGGAPGGGWYLRVALPSTMVLPSSYSTFATCSSSTIDVAQITSPKICGTIITPTTIVVSNTNPGISQVVGAGTYTMVIKNVTNPSAGGFINLTEVSVFDANSGQVTSSASSGNLDDFPIEIQAVTQPTSVPTLGWYGLVLLMLTMGVLGMAGLKRDY